MNEPPPSVSVILPTYNRAHLVGRAIRTVLDQSYSDLELIVIDDASTDETQRAVADFTDPRVHYLRRDQNEGPPGARNAGIAEARGQYIAFLDSDDVWLPEKLARQVKVFAQAPPTVGLVYTATWRIKGRKRSSLPPANIPRTEGYVHDQLLGGDFISISSVVLKAECLSEVGLFDQIPILEDWDLFLRIAQRYEFRMIEEFLVLSYISADSISEHNPILGQSFKVFLEKHAAEYAPHPALYARQIYSMGDFLGVQSGRLSEARQYFWQALWMQPLSIRYHAALLASLLGMPGYRAFSVLKNQIYEARLYRRSY